MSALDRRSVLLGAVVAGVVALLAGLVIGRLAESSNYGFVPFAVILVGMAVGGYVAARPQPDLAFMAGGTAAFLASAVAQTASLLVRLASGKALPPGYALGFVFTLLISASFGVVGGWIALRLDRQREAREEAPT